MNILQSYLLDLRFAWRQLRKSPGVTALAVLTLAFGIGPNTAMFTVVESVFARPLPYPHSDRLVYVGPMDAKGLASTSWLNFRDIRDQSRVLDAVGGFSEDIGVVQGRDGSVGVVAPGITPHILTMLGAQPLLGRTFSDEEGRSGGPKAVLLSEGLWRQAFGADPDILHRTIRVNGQSRSVVGVMPRGFRFPEQMGHDLEKGLWLPLQPTTEMLTERGYNFFLIVGRLRPDATMAQAKAELGAISERIRAGDAKAGSKLAFRATLYQDMLTGPVGPVFLALEIALVLVLLIACVNVANLLIARCLVRRHEFAVRAALGADRMRLVRQLIVEGGLLSALGCGIGLALAMLAVAAVHKLPPDTIPRGDEIAVRWTIVLILAGIATLTTVLSAFLPALLVARSDPQKALQGASRGVGSRSVKNRLSESLVAGEIALSALLLIATGLLFHTLWNLERAKLGFDVARITTFTSMPADASGFGNMAVSEDIAHAPTSVAITVYAPVLERLRHLPGVQAAALITAPPFSGINLSSSFDIVGRPHDQNNNLGGRITAVSGGYAGLMSTPVIRGRMITDDDTESAPSVVAINETLARKYFSGTDPIGMRLDLGGKDTGMIRPLTIVGVIGDQVDSSASQPPQPLLMIAYRQIPTTSLFYQALVKTVVNLAVKTRGDIAVAPATRAVFRTLAPDYALDNFQSMQQAVDAANFSQRLGLYLTAAFAGIATMMVIAGLYGVLAQVVGYRRREFGIRLAMGATRSGMVAMVLRQAVVLIAIGLACGLALAVWGGRLVKSFLYEVQPVDTLTYAAVVLLLLFVGTLAALVPAQRAASVEPVTTLREE
jgi:putative ABC transport system permease protein